MSKVYAFFDVDGTVIARDSFLLILWRSLAREPWRFVLLLPQLPVFLITLVFDLNRRYAKSCILWTVTVFKGKRGAIRHLRSVLAPTLQNIWFEEATPLIRELRAQGVSLCFVSASCAIWLRPMLSKFDPEPKIIIGSKLGFCLGGVCMASPNCYKKEKLVRIKERLGADFTWHSSYTDSPVDLPLLEAAPIRYVVNPSPKKVHVFAKTLGEDFKILHWHTQRKQ